MKLTSITIRYGLTYNLGNYSNVKPEIELTATLAPSDDVETAQQSLFATARALAEEQVDQALEEQGDPARFSREPRFDLIKRRTAPFMLAVVPAGVAIPHGFTTMRQGVRLSHAIRTAQRLLDDSPSLALRDCRDGDLSPLADLPEPPAPVENEVPF